MNRTLFVFSATVPALLVVSASEGVNILRNTPSILSTLQEERIEVLMIPLHAASQIIHIHLRSATLNPATSAPHEAPLFDIAGKERLLQDNVTVDEVLAQGAWITRARRLRGQELVETQLSIHLTVTSALSCKDRERATGVIKAAVAKVLAKRK